MAFAETLALTFADTFAWARVALPVALAVTFADTLAWARVVLSLPFTKIVWVKVELAVEFWARVALAAVELAEALPVALAVTFADTLAWAREAFPEILALTLAETLAETLALI